MAEIPTGDWSWVNDDAERFEQAWKKGPRPRIEDFLAKVPEARQPPLLAELIRVERELRARAGESPTVEEYQRRFPDRDDVVTSVFAAVQATSGKPSLLPTDGVPTVGARGEPSKVPPELANHADYAIIRELGHGGMGVVFLAHNRIMGRDEVLKVIGPDNVQSPVVFDRFRREIRAVARLQHPNIVTAHTAFRCGASLVFAMEYVEGLDLARLIRAKGPVPVAHACYFVHQLALGLQHAHEAGMVHRDIKPNNLMLTHKRGKAVIKVLDFGLAKAEREQNLLDPVAPGTDPDAKESGGLTLPGELLGTPDFIAPEQSADSQSADIRADIYSLGCTLYYLLTGRPPFPSSSMRDTLRAQRTLEAVPLNQVRADVPPELAALVAKMMAKEPAHRFQTPNDVAEAIAPFYKKPHLDSPGAEPGVDQEYAANAGAGAAGARGGAPGSEVGMWSSLIDFKEPEDDADAAAELATPARERPRWLWPAAAAGILIFGLFGAWTAGVFERARVKNDAVELARTEESKPIRARTSALEASEPRNTSPREFGPSPGAEAPAAPQDNNNTKAAFGDGASAPFPPVGEPPPEDRAPTPVLGSATPNQVFHEITSIRTADVAIQARLISESGQVLYETGGRNRALWRVDLKEPDLLCGRPSRRIQGRDGFRRQGLGLGYWAGASPAIRRPQGSGLELGGLEGRQVPALWGKRYGSDPLGGKDGARHSPPRGSHESSQLRGFLTGRPARGL